jgi:hypothetical protein
LLAGDADVGEQSIVQLEEIPQLPSPPELLAKSSERLLPRQTFRRGRWFFSNMG